MIEQLRARARELLERGEVTLLIGYGQRDGRTFPLFIRKPEEVDRLVFNPFCANNLALYLVRKEVMAGQKKVAIVARPQEIKAVAVLVQENQLDPERVVLVGVFCAEPKKEGAACEMLAGRTLKELEAEIAARCKEAELSAEALAAVRELEARAPEDRWAFWQREFERCIRCYACRQACPLCYCERCFCEKNQPQWVPTSARPIGNYVYNMVRALHLAGRCVLCGACENACPMGLPLGLLNRKLANEVKESFGYQAGYDHEAPPPMASFKPEDKQEFIQ